MGCVSSSLLDQDDEFTQIGGSTGIGHHFVSLTSTTYGLLTVDSTKTTTDQNHPPTPPRFGLGSFLKIPLSEAKSVRSEPKTPEVINSWELMAGLDSESSRFSPSPITNYTSLQTKPSFSLLHTVAELDSRISRSPRLLFNKENSNVYRQFQNTHRDSTSEKYYNLDEFEKNCPANGENRVVIYTTTLRGVRKTFEDCNAVRAVFQGLGILFNERDISMDRGFREELKGLLKDSNKQGCLIVPPRVFIKGRYIGGYEEIFRIHEQGCCLIDLLEGLPKSKIGGNGVCDGCGGVRFLPCFNCSGSCKIVRVCKDDKQVVVRCPDCNENGLVLCPICS